METCNHEFIPVTTGVGRHFNHSDRCIYCGKNMDEIMRNGAIDRAIADLMNEPQHVAFFGHELNSK